MTMKAKHMQVIRISKTISTKHDEYGMTNKQA